ncbi:MAG: hypothetical protein Q9222_005087 [Ikaeria aurantiellina]
MADIKYFTCTLGQAAALGEKLPASIKTINDFLNHQVRVTPDRFAVGFALPNTKSTDRIWPFRILTDVNIKSEVHNSYTDLAKESARVSEDRIETVAIPHDFLEQIGTTSKSKANLSVVSSSAAPATSASEIAYFFHTSGTSSGLPKPISQDHHGAIGVLPCLQNGHEKATFTTTPLYHGGIADCFRAWTSGAMIWLFPGKDIPITSSNVLRCLECAERASASKNAPRVRYFSSVPYVLQMVSSEPEGLQVLEDMDIVGVGGAALPQEVGDSLVAKGINLVSRFGSAECGFLLSSHRAYGQDKDWQYLRDHGSNLLSFEQQHNGSGLSELIVCPEWPHMAKRNCEDGSLATADLFEPHPSAQNAWRYHSRADSQLTLITGKKFDPAPLEAAIATSNLLSEVLIFGNGKPYPGALLFRSNPAKTIDASQLREEVWKVVDRLNKEGQPHTRLSRNMLIIMPVDAQGLEKSSKGTIMRGPAEKTFTEEITKAYTQIENNVNGDHGFPQRITSDDKVPVTILEIIKSVLGTNSRIPEDADLFSYGVDSVACMAIRAKLQQKIMPSEASELPLNVVYDCGTINTLSQFIIDIRKGRVMKTEDELQTMRDLVAKYSNFSAPPVSDVTSNGTEMMAERGLNVSIDSSKEVVLLTGATGALGTHILHTLRSSPTTSHVICLVRASTPLGAHQRINKALLARNKPGLPPFSSPHPNNSTNWSITCLPFTLSHPHLDLSPSAYSALAKSTTLIIHAAWAVNFTTRLHSFERDYIAGLAYLLTFFSSIPTSSVSRSRPRFLFLSSTASVTSHSASPIPELISTDPATASPLGYSRSKWVAEALCDSFHHQLGGDKTVAVLRIGQLTGDSENGVWNMSEAWPLMLSTALPPVGALPDLGEQMGLDWMVVDGAAESVLEVAGALRQRTGGGNGVDGVEERVGGDAEGCKVYHILNPHHTPTWSSLLDVIKATPRGSATTILPPMEWLARLESVEGEVPAKKLVGLWKSAFADDEGKEGGDGDGGKVEGGSLVFDVEKARGVSKVMRELKPLGREDLRRLWGWVEGRALHKGGEGVGE